MPTKKQVEQAERLLRDFDWSKVDALTDAQIIEAANSDPDSSLPTEAELAEFDLVIPAKARREWAEREKAEHEQAEREKAGEKPPKEAAE